MLRDIPRIYLLIFGFVVVTVLLVFWYREMFLRDSDVLQLNEVLLVNAVTEVDNTSRIYEGVFMLADTFETKVWETLEDNYPEGSEVEFEYMFDVSDTRFTNVTEERVSSSQRVSSGQKPSPYVIGSENASDIPQTGDAEHYTKKPIKAIRVKVKDKGDGIDDWTYVGSVRVDIASRNANQE